jgi:hypothetical protein
MPTDAKSPNPSGTDADRNPSAARPPTPAAARALAEAAARRAKRERNADGQPKEVGGPSGPEPTRYGDWEVKGLTSDF